VSDKANTYSGCSYIFSKPETYFGIWLFYVRTKIYSSHFTCWYSGYIFTKRKFWLLQLSVNIQLVLGTTSILKSIIFWDMTPCSRLLHNRLHSVISQKMILFTTTAVKTSNPTSIFWSVSCLVKQTFHYFNCLSILYFFTNYSCIHMKNYLLGVHIFMAIFSNIQWHMP
jgi:hypothetical protein